jgi:hypothetical protein
MIDRLGESTCSTGTHANWPARARYAKDVAPDIARERADLIHAEVTETRFGGRPRIQLDQQGSGLP